MGHSSVKTLECFYIRSRDAKETQARKVSDNLFLPKSNGAIVRADMVVCQTGYQRLIGQRITRLGRGERARDVLERTWQSGRRTVGEV